MNTIETRPIIGEKYKLKGIEGFVLVGEEDYGMKGDNHYLFACFIEEGNSFFDNPLWIYSIKKDNLILLGDNVVSKDDKYPFGRMEGTEPSYEKFSRLIKLAAKEN